MVDLDFGVLLYPLLAVALAIAFFLLMFLLKRLVTKNDRVYIAELHNFKNFGNSMGANYSESPVSSPSILFNFKDVQAEVQLRRDRGANGYQITFRSANEKWRGYTTPDVREHENLQIRKLFYNLEQLAASKSIKIFYLESKFAEVILSGNLELEESEYFNQINTCLETFYKLNEALSKLK